MKRGTLVVMSSPQGTEDKRISDMKRGRIAVIHEITNNGYARVHFFGDKEELTYLVHPESIKIHV